MDAFEFSRQTLNICSLFNMYDIIARIKEKVSTQGFMPKIVDFVVIFDDGVRKRHYHETERGKVIYFAVQLEVKVNNEWKAAIRYDCSHGFSHMDKYNIRGNKIKKRLNLNFESALNYGDWDINKNWLKYKQEFLKGENDG